MREGKRALRCGCRFLVGKGFGFVERCGDRGCPVGEVLVEEVTGLVDELKCFAGVRKDIFGGGVQGIVGRWGVR